MNRIAVLFLCLAMFLVPFACKHKGVSNGENPPIKISINAWSGYALAFLAQEKGLFKKNGVEVELVLDKSSPETLQSFKDGKVDGCFQVFPDVVLLDAQGFAARVVYVIDYSTSGDAVVARPGIRSLSDLRGRTASFEMVNTFSQMFVLKLLEKAGLGEADLRFAVVSAHDVLKALDEGKIDAGHTWEPTKSKALKKGYKVLGQASDVPGIILDVLIFSQDVIDKRPNDIKAVVKSLSDALALVKADPQGSINIMADRMGMTAAEMKSGLDGMHQPDLAENKKLMTARSGLSLYDSGSAIIDFYLERGQLSRIPEIYNMIEPKFVKELGTE